MKKLLPLLLLPLAAGCQSQQNFQYTNNHWTAWSIGTSMERHFLNYDEERDGAYENRLSSDADSVLLTIRRHFFNSNPDNPFQGQHASSKPQNEE